MTDDVPEFIPAPPPPSLPARPRRQPLLPPPAPEPPMEPVMKRGLLDWMGGRAVRRPHPRLGVGLAGAGSTMFVVGAITIGGNELVGPSGGDGSQYPGLLISLAVIVTGVSLTERYRHGPLAAAGVAGSALALPPFLVFLTYSSTSPPSFNTILLVSCLGWAAAYVAGPGRGHTFYLGLGLIGAWLWFIEVTEHLFSFPVNFLFGLAQAASAGTIGDSSSSSPPISGFDTAAPDATTIGVYTLLFAVGYLVIAGVLDHRGYRGVATPFVFVGIVTLITGVAALGDDLQQVGTGIAFTMAGLVLAYLGATDDRRATGWAGAALVFVGITTVVADPFDTPTAFGMAEIVVGTGVIAAAHGIATQWREPPETEPVASRFYNAGSVQPSGPPPPPAGSVLG